MKSAVLIAICTFSTLLLPRTSDAGQNINPRAAYCSNYAQALGTAISFRDSGYDPKTALANVNGYKILSTQDKKNIVNAAFFDKGLYQVRANDLTFQGQIEMLCENNWKPLHTYQPLK